ncbi:hypothetical protein HZA45_01575 [Candidatus Peregrinibacteria bacterium]|nr:hypothetical protein [Candidatus Peregrinibacteria bacterium]
MPARTTLRPKKKTVVKKAKKRGPALKILGRVVHYYDRLGVAIVELAAPMKVGDTVKMKRGESESLQEIHSLQIDHTPVTSAKKKAVVGLKVDQEVAEGTLVMKP